VQVDHRAGGRASAVAGWVDVIDLVDMIDLIDWVDMIDLVPDEDVIRGQVG
jgi:hypothetical protein